MLFSVVAVSATFTLVADYRYRNCKRVGNSLLMRTFSSPPGVTTSAYDQSVMNCGHSRGSNPVKGDRATGVSHPVLMRIMQ